jgi:regulator of protease activity HflC (stomatin/prohibitin superfamily)
MEMGAMSAGLVLAAIFFGLITLRSIRITQEWRRAVVLRLGRFHAVKGPGLYLLWPIDTIATIIDLRIQTINITAEQALTKDTVAVGVDAIVFWQVVDARAAAVNIVNVYEAIERVSQTSLREMIGASELGRLLSDRHTADLALRETIAAKTRDWGVAVRAVEIRDVAIPAALQDAMSRQAQAEREQVLKAAEIYGRNPVALQLRQMNLLYEMNKERGATVLIPTDMAASLGRVFPQQEA